MAKTALGDVCCVSWLHILASFATYWPCTLARVEYSILVGGCAITIGTKPFVPDRQRAQPKEVGTNKMSRTPRGGITEIRNPGHQHLAKSVGSSARVVAVSARMSS